MMWKRILWTILALLILAGVSYAAQEAPPPVKPPGEAAANDPPDLLKFGPVKLGLDSLVRPELQTTSRHHCASSPGPSVVDSPRPER